MQEREKVQEIPVKVYRTSDRLMIAAPLPGMEPEDIQIQVEQGNRLVIRGEVRGLLKNTKELLVDEWSVGKYYREVPLPNAVDGINANVTYGNGVLVVALPISNQTTPATIKMNRTVWSHGGYVGNAGHPTI